MDRGAGDRWQPRHLRCELGRADHHAHLHAVDLERVEPVAWHAIERPGDVELGLAVDLLAGRRNDESCVVVVRAVDEVRNALAAERPVSDMAVIRRGQRAERTKMM